MMRSGCDVSCAGKLGPKGASARVIYGQTDSVFVHLPDCSPAEAVSIGQHAGKLVSEAFPPEMTLQFEKVHGMVYGSTKLLRAMPSHTVIGRSHVR